MGVVEKGKENISKPRNNLENYEEIRTSVRNSPMQEVETDGAATSQI